MVRILLSFLPIAEKYLISDRRSRNDFNVRRSIDDRSGYCERRVFFNT
ncbi:MULTISPECIES: hypothetical protein [Chroococcidiopsis]|nr:MULTISPECIES: hypothetical protein [Chroococcidiopsis]MBE9014677.1 hypothetical protein [Chroococcidiopsidales cyanobacterium LEGE 13417]URD49573.1 hypothetical protein M5J74_25035 [Chroococcidiopsis sp. CCNUC1]